MLIGCIPACGAPAQLISQGKSDYAELHDAYTSLKKAQQQYSDMKRAAEDAEEAVQRAKTNYATKERDLAKVQPARGESRERKARENADDRRRGRNHAFYMHLRRSAAHRRTHSPLTDPWRLRRLAKQLMAKVETARERMNLASRVQEERDVECRRIQEIYYHTRMPRLLDVRPATVGQRGIAAPDREVRAC